MEIKGKVVIITGASSGIGKACAEVFGKAGARVVITGRNKINLLQAEQYLKKLSIDVLAIVSDVSKEEDCEKIARQTVSVFHRIDVVINNAGISMRAMFEEMDISVMKKVMDINFMGTVYMTKYALPEIIKNKGCIVGISSIAGYRGLPGRTAYSASKFAMNGFLETLRTELMPKGVSVVVVSPGFTNTNIRKTALAADGTSQGESPKDESSLMSSEQVAEYVYRSVRTGKKELVLTTQGKLTVFLNKLFPRFMDKMVYNHFKKEEGTPLK